MSKIEVNTVAPQCGTTLTLGESGDTVTLGTGASQSGFGRTGTVDWQTGSIKTGDFTAVNTQGFFVDTNSGVVTATLPAGSAGAIISFQDYRNTFDDNALTITPNGSEKINTGEGPVRLDTQGEGITLVYIDSTVGWRSIQDNVFDDVGSNFINATGGTITNTPTCKIHPFTGPGTFCVSSLAVCAANNQVSYLVVAGGGGGGGTNNFSYAAGGGGAGGFREDKSPTTPYTASPLDGAGNISVTQTAFPIEVGGGGAAAPNSTPNGQGTQGGTSTFSTISSAGGGGGGAGANPGSGGLNGGSGGGAGSSCGGSPHGGGTGNTPSTSPAQGFNGGSSTDGHGPASGGGGATAVGTNSTPGTCTPRAGGAGATTVITNSPVTYAVGGASGNYPAGPTTRSNGTAGPANSGTGGGGGGGKTAAPAGASAAGGSGIVVIRYKIA